MDFFEALEKRVYVKWSGGKCLYMSEDWKFGRKAGIDATIEALKEMKVGEYRGRLTGIDVRESGPVSSSAHIEFDGEEVVVMVFRRVEKISDREHIIHTGEELDGTPCGASVVDRSSRRREKEDE